MKHLIHAAALVAALSAPTTASAENEQERCSGVASDAHMIMEFHQRGLPLADLLALFARNFSDPAFLIAYETLAVIAYGEPRYQTEAAQQRSADNFRDVMHVWCLS